MWKAFRLSPEDSAKEVGGDLFYALFNGALEEFKQGNFEGAINYLRESLKVRPDSGKASGELGKALISLGAQLLSKAEFSQAIAAFKEAVTLLPDKMEAWIGLARSLFENGDVLKSFEALKGAIKTHPESSEPGKMLMSFGARLLSHGRVRDAISAYGEAVNALPQNLDAYMGLAKALLKDGKVLRAIGTARKALEIDPASREAHSLLMNLLLKR